VVAPSFVGDLGDPCGRKGDMAPISGRSVRLSPSSVVIMGHVGVSISRVKAVAENIVAAKV
jgi:hypothetical protein